MHHVRRVLARLDPFVQIGLVIGLAEVYRLLRRLLPTDWPQAIANAHHVFRLEEVTHTAWERGVQQWFLQFPEIVRGMNWFYLSSHFAVTGVFFAWLYWRNREGFSIFRDGFLLATAIALLIHWRYPTAPPRLAHMGIKDTIDLYSGVNIGRPHHERRGQLRVVRLGVPEVFGVRVVAPWTPAVEIAASSRSACALRCESDTMPSPRRPWRM